MCLCGAELHRLPCIQVSNCKTLTLHSYLRLTVLPVIPGSQDATVDCVSAERCLSDEISSTTSLPLFRVTPVEEPPIGCFSCLGIFYFLSTLFAFAPRHLRLAFHFLLHTHTFSLLPYILLQPTQLIRILDSGDGKDGLAVKSTCYLPRDLVQVPASTWLLTTISNSSSWVSSAFSWPLWDQACMRCKAFIHVNQK